MIYSCSSTIGVLLYFQASSIALHDLKTRAGRIYSYIERKIVHLLLFIHYGGQSECSGGMFARLSSPFFNCVFSLHNTHTNTHTRTYAHGSMLRICFIQAPSATNCLRLHTFFSIDFCCGP